MGMKNKTIQQLKNLLEEDVAYTRTITTVLYQAWVRVEGVFAPVRRQASSLSLVAFVLVVATYVLFPKLANADMEFEYIGLSSETVSMIIASIQNVTQDYGRLPVSEEAPARRHYHCSCPLGFFGHYLRRRVSHGKNYWFFCHAFNYLRLQYLRS